MDLDEKRIAHYLAGHGFTATRFSKGETHAGKTPDFRVLRTGRFLFYCEVKSSPADRWLDQEMRDAAPGQRAGGVRNDPVFNRLTTDIHDAVKQFDAVNEDQQRPNVLALVNHDKMCGFSDLLGILTGNFYADDGEAYPIYRQFSDARIQDEKGKIHLFIWVDDYKPNRMLFSRTDEAHHATLCTIFRINNNEIRDITL